jgi:hypothetical protein
MSMPMSMSTPNVQTYHCLCSTLILTTTHDLESLPRRSNPTQDGALILASPTVISETDEVSIESQRASSIFTNVVSDRKPVIIRREDGFEKKILLRCARCKLVLGYNLDDAHFETLNDGARPTYLLPGGLTDTRSMRKGNLPEAPAWAVQAV